MDRQKYMDQREIKLLRAVTETQSIKDLEAGGSILSVDIRGLIGPISSPIGVGNGERYSRLIYEDYGRLVQS